MKKILLIIFAFGFASFSYSQQKNVEAKSSISTEKKNNFENWSAELNLSEAQKNQVLEIQNKYKEEKVKLRKSGTVEQFKNLQNAEKAEINAILTPEQIKKDEAYAAQKLKEKNFKADLKTAVR